MTDESIKKTRYGRRKTNLKTYEVGIRGSRGNRITLNGHSKAEVIEHFQALTGHDLQTEDRSIIVARCIGTAEEDKS